MIWTTIISRGWQLIKSKPVIAATCLGLGLLAGLLVGGRGCQGIKDRKWGGVVAGQSIVLPDSPKVKGVPLVPSRTAPDLPILDLSKKQREEAARKFNRPDLVPGAGHPGTRDTSPVNAGDARSGGTGAGAAPAPGTSPEPAREVLARKSVPPAEWGGELLVSRVPDNPVDVDFVANRAPFVQFPAAVFIGGRYGKFFNLPNETTDDLIWDLHVKAELIKLKGTVVVGVEGGLKHILGQDTPYVEATADWKVKDRH